jgi:hypothetical protein
LRRAHCGREDYVGSFVSPDLHAYPRDKEPTVTVPLNIPNPSFHRYLDPKPLLSLIKFLETVVGMYFAAPFFLKGIFQHPGCRLKY